MDQAPAPTLERTLAIRAGRCRLAIPLTTVRQILDAGGETAMAPADPRALGVSPVSLAKVLGVDPLQSRPALLLFDSHLGPVLLSVCQLDGILDAKSQHSVPQTAPIRWPGLVSHAIGGESGEDVVFVLDPVLLMGVIEAVQVDDDDHLAEIL